MTTAVAFGLLAIAVLLIWGGVKGRSPWAELAKLLRGEAAFDG